MNDNYSFDLSQYELINRIGSGQYGEVYKAKEKKTGETVAVKISFSSLEDEEDEKDSESVLNLVREVNIMSELNHPSIVKFIGYSPIDFHGDQRPVIVTEFMSKDSLTKIIELEQNNVSDPNWTLTKKLINLYGIASAMAYLHANNIIHRDLKPDNILMDDNLNPKIADFGFSKILHQNQNSMSIASQVGFKGTATFSPPEILSSETPPFSKEGDVYAFAMIAFEILTAKYPFKKLGFKKILRKNLQWNTTKD